MVQATTQRPVTQQPLPPAQAIAEALWGAYARVFATEVPVHARPGPVWTDSDPRAAPELAVLHAAAMNGAVAGQRDGRAGDGAPLEPLWTNADTAFALAVISRIAPPRLIASGEPAGPEYLTADEFLGQEYL
jgi:hypothetical protein